MLVSADEKLGVDVLVLDELEPDADGVDDEDDGALVELELLSDGEDEADGVDEDEDDGVLDDEDDDCATASVDSAKSTAAVMTPRVLDIVEISGWLGKRHVRRKRCAAGAEGGTRYRAARYLKKSPALGGARCCDAGRLSRRLHAQVVLHALNTLDLARHLGGAPGLLLRGDEAVQLHDAAEALHVHVGRGTEAGVGGE